MNLTKPLNDLRANFVIATAAVAALSTLGAVVEVQAKVTAFLSAGATCTGAPSTSFRANGPAVKVSLCITATTEILCGNTAQLQATNDGESGRFHVTAVALGPTFSDPNSDLSFPIAITNPPGTTDFGATVSRASVATNAKQLLVTFDVSPQANATEAVYAISLAPMSSVSVGADGACMLPTDASIAASFNLIRHSGREPKK